jgi:RNA polymerase sigma-70 factor (ECF subfamily)
MKDNGWFRQQNMATDRAATERGEHREIDANTHDFLVTIGVTRADYGAGMRAYAQANEAQLMAWTTAGDRLAFDTLVGRHLERAYRTALRVLGNPSDAEEVAQEAMMRAWCNAASWDPARSRFTTWLYRIVVNLALDFRRRPITSPLEEAGDPPDTAADPAARLEAQQRGQAVSEALANLSTRQRVALTLIYYEGLSGREAAAALNVSLRGLEGLLRRGRQLLKEMLVTREL